MQQPHAVIALPNNIEIDARAHRNGLALVSAGYRVTMVGFGSGIPPQGEIAGMPYVLCAPAPATAGAAAPKPLTFTYRAVRKAFHVTMKRRPPQKVLKAVARVDAVTGAVKKKTSHAVDAVARRVSPPKPVEVDPGLKLWERALPQVPVMTAAMKPTLMELRPDVIVTDVHLLPLATEVASAFRSTGHRVGVVYDAREYVYGLASEDPNITQGFPAIEAEYIGQVDATFTVCEPIAHFLQEKYDLPVEPALVPNAPIGDLPPVEHPMTIRDFLKLPAETPILVYAGGLSYHRGVHDVISALPELPEVHLAIGARRGSSYVAELEQQAERLGVTGRVHFIPFAPTHEVAEYLSSATAAIFPFLPVGNHNWAAPNKYYEAVQARLPILTSNMEWLSARITDLGIGEVFEHSNPASIVAATRTLLANLDAYRTRITDDLVRAHTFEEFEPTVQQIVLGATAERVRAGLRPSSLQSQLTAIRSDMLRQRASLSDADIFEPRPRLRIGTANTGGQPLLWATSLMREHPEAMAESAWIYREGPLKFPVDETITYHQWVSPAWQRALMRKLENRVTHVLTESARAMVGARFGKFFYEEIGYFAETGIRQGLVFHGSDIRNPRRHAEIEPDSPFADPTEELTAVLQKQVDAITPHVLAFEGPVYVTTNDLLDYLPDARWLPIVVDPAFWASDVVPLERPGAPIVFHVPSKGSMKGSDTIDAVCERLQADGLIRYIRDEELTRTQMRDAMMRADIVIDQLRLGDYGITAVEAMSGGKVVLGHVADRVRDRIDGGVPIVEADASTLEEVLRGVLADPARARQLSAAGRDYVLRWHDGTRSAEVLADFMGL